MNIHDDLDPSLGTAGHGACALPQGGRGARLAALAVVAAVVLTSPSDAQGEAPQMVRWEILATVTDVNDPLGLFPDVRAGDPVRGILKYDLTLLPNPLFSDFYQRSFTNEIWIDVARMVVENPRSGAELAFQTDAAGWLADVSILNDYPDDQTESDLFFATQSVEPPAGYQGVAPAVAVLLTGPTSVFPEPPALPTIDDRPPAALSLDDWPVAGIVFYDAFLEDPTATSIEAEIYSLEMVTTPPLDGDYDYDGIVDGRDLHGWSQSYGGSLLYADANGDNEVDGVDFLLWQRNYGGTQHGVEPASGVPEPTTWLLFVICVAAASLTRRNAAGQHAEYQASS